MAFEAPFAWHPCRGAARSTRSLRGSSLRSTPGYRLATFQVAVPPSRALVVPPSQNLRNWPHEILRAARKYKLFALRIRADKHHKGQFVHPRVSAKSEVLLSIRHLKNLRGTQRFYREVVRRAWRRLNDRNASRSQDARAFFLSASVLPSRRSAGRFITPFQIVLKIVRLSARSEYHCAGSAPAVG